MVMVYKRVRKKQNNSPGWVVGLGDVVTCPYSGIEEENKPATAIITWHRIIKNVISMEPPPHPLFSVLKRTST